MPKLKLVITPTPNNQSNMYISNLAHSLADYFEIVNYGKKRTPVPKELFLNLFRADAFHLNWIENEPLLNHAFFRYLLVQVFLVMAKVLNKKIIWTFHNLEPHNAGNTRLTISLRKRLMKVSDLIVHHTRESIELTNSKKNLCFFHPFESISSGGAMEDGRKPKYDILIWGKIAPYKGVAEFLEFLKTDEELKKLNVFIAGKVSTNAYRERMNDALSSNTVFQDRFYSDEELFDLHNESRYVFFSHQGASVLNSGQLVYSLRHMVDVIGPQKGAFKELGEEGVVFTYESFAEVGEIIRKNSSISRTAKKKYISEHSWAIFAKELNGTITSL